MALTKITANIIEDGAISTASLANTSITADKLAATLDLTGKTITVATATAGDNDTTVASTAFVSTAIANLAPLASPDFTGDATFDTSTLVIDSTNNNVGIGTPSPTVNLDVYNGSGWGGVDIDGTSGGEIRLQKAGTRYGGIYANDSTGLVILAENGVDSTLFYTGGSPRMTINSSGNIGIGASNPDVKLHLEDPSRVDIKFEKTGAETHYIRKDGDFLRFRGHDDNTVLFELKNNTNGLNVCSFPAGNLGIGTTTPSAEVPLTVYYSNTSQFHVGGAQGGISNNVYYNGSAYTNRNTSAGGALLQMGTDGSFAMRRATSGSSPTLNYSMYIDSTGNVGIGKIPNRSRKLEVAGDINLDNGYGLEWEDGGVGIVGSGATDVMTFATAGAERM